MWWQRTAYWRPCVHIHCIYFNSDGDDNVMEKVERCYRDMGIEFNQNEIDPDW